jgi:hypothetical protein
MTTNVSMTEEQEIVIPDIKVSPIKLNPVRGVSHTVI